MFDEGLQRTLERFFPRLVGLPEKRARVEVVKLQESIYGANSPKITGELNGSTIYGCLEKWGVLEDCVQDGGWPVDLNVLPKRVRLVGLKHLLAKRLDVRTRQRMGRPERVVWAWFGGTVRESLLEMDDYGRGVHFLVAEDTVYQLVDLNRSINARRRGAVNAAQDQEVCIAVVQERNPALSDGVLEREELSVWPRGPSKVLTINPRTAYTARVFGVALSNYLGIPLELLSGVELGKARLERRGHYLTDSMSAFELGVGQWWPAIFGGTNLSMEDLDVGC